MLRFYLTPLFLLLICLPLYADDGSATFQEAMKAYKAGDYTQAMEGFETAQSLGMANPALYYNLGVVYFRLEYWDRAVDAFKKTANYPKMAPLAYYNIGLVKRRQNDTQAAEYWFERTLEGSRDAKLNRLARHALDNLPRTNYDWNSFLSIGLGYDDNVTLENDALAIASEESDSFYELFGFTQGVLSGTDMNGVLLRGSLFGDFYSEQSDFSLAELNLGLYRRFRMRDWKSEGGIYTTYSTLGSDPYLSSGNLVLDARRAVSDSMTLRFRVRFKAIHSLDQQSEGLEGSAFDLRTEGIWALDRSDARIRGYYQLELNDRQDIETATSFSSLSPTRHTFYIDYRRALAPDWQFKASGSYRHSRYDDENVDSTGGTATTRTDKRKGVAFELSRRRIWKDFQLALEYRHTDNDSNIDSYSYDRNTLLFNLMKSF